VSLSADTFSFVADLMRRRTAVVLLVGKENLVESRLQPLASQAGLAGVEEYVNTLRVLSHGAELDRVVEALTTNETSWFRDLGSFRALTGHVIPTLMGDRPELALLRVWSAACSTGQEPYSIAMALLDSNPGVRAKIAATDISLEVILRGRAGRYSQLEVNRGLPASMLVRHFARQGTDWEVSAQVRSTVTFSRRNLLSVAPPGGPFDVVFLRNALIYFDLATRARVLRRVRASISPGGFLMLGAAESTLGIDDGWERVLMGQSSAYRVKPGRAA